MQCSSCHSEWKVNENASLKRIKTCPFCGASLKPEEKPDLTTIEGILRSIVLKYGEKIYNSSNAQQFKALLSDLASNFPKERDQLRVAIDKQIPSRLLKKNDSDDEEKSHEAMESSYILVYGIGLQPAIAQRIVEILSIGLGWKIDMEEMDFQDHKISDTNEQESQSIQEELQEELDELHEKYDTLKKQHENLKAANKTLKEKWQIAEEHAKELEEQIGGTIEYSTELQNQPEQEKISEQIYENNEADHSSIEEGFVFVPGGTFLMGSNDGTVDEKPIHSVTVSSFYMCDHEVTQKEYIEMVGSNPSYFIDDHKPVERVSWLDAIFFCNLKSQKEGLTPCYTYSDGTYTCNFNANGYRLPTEAEWEYAARGGNNTYRYIYSGSDSIENVAWFSDNSGNESHDVKTKSPNELGLYDMSGNVWEWCWDLYGSYKQASQTNPTGASSGSYRIFRGGSWFDYSTASRVHCRNFNYPASSDYFIGFRVVRSVQ